MTEEIGIGTRLWRFDENRRVYRDRHSPPVYEEHFVPDVITGETKGTWLIGRLTVNKRTLREPSRGGFSGCQWFTDAGKVAKIWAKHHRREIVDKVDRCDVPTLRKIAELLDGSPTP